MVFEFNSLKMPDSFLLVQNLGYASIFEFSKLRKIKFLFIGNDLVNLSFIHRITWVYPVYFSIKASDSNQIQHFCVYFCVVFTRLPIRKRFDLWVAIYFKHHWRTIACPKLIDSIQLEESPWELLHEIDVFSEFSLKRSH